MWTLHLSPIERGPTDGSGLLYSRGGHLRLPELDTEDGCRKGPRQEPGQESTGPRWYLFCQNSHRFSSKSGLQLWEETSVYIYYHFYIRDLSYPSVKSPTSLLVSSPSSRLTSHKYPLLSGFPSTSTTNEVTGDTFNIPEVVKSITTSITESGVRLGSK